PFATGLPHYGHIVASCLKDVVPRFKTMQGYYVPRRWGWDCHGLPIENNVEKELGFQSKKDIVAYGVDKFNEQCRSKVLAYANDWKTYIRRLGRWVDMEHDYKTMDLGFMESVWWVFKQLWDKGLVYEGYKTMHICPRCETTLSHSEVTEGYKTIKDISVIAKFTLTDTPDTHILAWTTTPWTLPGNVALAINPDISYSVVQWEGDKYILASSLVEKVFASKEYVVLQHSIDIQSYIGKTYVPLFPFFQDKNLKNSEQLYTIQPASFVTDTDGTGVVHIAPAFGEDDYRLGQEKNLPFIQHVGMDGRFTVEVIDWAGQLVKSKEDHQATDVEIVKYLANKQRLFSKEKYEHSYPHCWRCDTPLLNYAKSSWFVKVTQVKDRLLENNNQTYWFPTHLKEGRAGQWLEGARDWAISRERFWASVMPVWKCEKCDTVTVIGSLAELKEYSGQEVTDLHKHIVDRITFACSCGGTMSRIPEVLDTWFDSGSMPFAQNHYLGTPLENFDPQGGVNFPADFIAEGVDQTRCWFYYLNVISSAFAGKQAFKNVLVNGIVLAEDGQKMSKRLQNYPDPMTVMNAYGADALRFYLMSSPIVKGEDLHFSEKDVREVYNKVVNTFWNVFTFYSMYFPTPEQFEGFDMNTLKDPLDAWALSRLELTTQEVTEKLESYDLASAARVLSEYITELSQWYVRRIRDRIKDESSEGRIQAGATLFFILRETTKLLAPLCPFISDEIYRGLGPWNEKYQSVHLESWPIFIPEFVHREGIEQMDTVRMLIERALSVRSKAGIKVRQPLSILSITKTSLDPALYYLLCEEVNVKEVVCEKELRNGPNWIVDDEMLVSIDIAITLELREEGLLRDIVRQINALRKEKGLTIADRVTITIHADTEIAALIVRYNDTLANQVLATSVTVGEMNDSMTPIKLENYNIHVSLE
ncbi:MAG: isoleucine--tRNA ligase, partial [Patescibacteria group bacterium]